MSNYFFIIILASHFSFFIISRFFVFVILSSTPAHSLPNLMLIMNPPSGDQAIARHKVAIPIMAGTLVAMLLLLLAMHSWSPALTDNPFVLSRQVRVSNSTLFESSPPEGFSIPLGAPSFLWCSRKCGIWSGCRLWCVSADKSECLISMMIVMPTYQEEDVAQALLCYTRRPKDFAARAEILASPVSTTLSERTASNLVDGIYNLKISQCFFPEGGDYLWLRLVFQTPVTFRFVKMLAQPSGKPELLLELSNLEVRYGMSDITTAGNFSSLKLFGRYDGPVTEFGQEISLESPTPVTAKTISVQKMEADGKFPICHIEVY